MDQADPVIVRDLVPKDFYFVQVLRNKEASDNTLAILLFERICLNVEATSQLTAAQFRAVLEWVGENVFKEKLMPAEQWLETAFHLCKQRWDSSMEWLETQPVPKILLMIQINNRHVEEQNKEAKKSAKKKR